MLPVLYQDEDYIAIDKPAGLLVHRSMIDRHETRFAVQLLRDQIGQPVFPLHRLDKPTSGVLLFALHRQAAQFSQTLFVEHKVQKTYLAIVRGYTPTQDIIDYALKEQLDKIADKDADKDKAAQSAITTYSRLATVELPYPVGRYDSARYSLLSLQPKTGRKHQLRRHMKHIFHPIVGDTTHGDGKQNQFFREQLCWRRLMLMANRLEFIHPKSKVPVSIEAIPNGEFAEAMNSLEWKFEQKKPG